METGQQEGDRSRGQERAALCVCGPGASRTGLSEDAPA